MLYSVTFTSLVINSNKFFVKTLMEEEEETIPLRKSFIYLFIFL